MTIAKAIAVRDSLLRIVVDKRQEEATRERAARLAEIIEAKLHDARRRAA